MALPVPSFWNLPPGSEPLSLLDQQFQAIAVTGVLPCAAAGTNALALTPGANVYVPTAYTTGLTIAWVQPLTTVAGAVTINVAGLGAVSGFKGNGATALGAGDLVGGLIYTGTYSSSLSSGSGGFSVNVLGGGGSGGAGVTVSDTAPLSPVQGQLWWDSTGALLYMWYADPTSAQWVNVNNYGPGIAGTAPPTVPPSLPGAVQGTFKHLSISVPSATTVTVTADALVVYDGTLYTTVLNVNSTITATGTGANGLDTGALAQGTWYAVWVISGTVGTAAVLSLSATAPTMPSGYTARARVGWVTTAPTTTNIVKTIQLGRLAQYVLTGTAPNVAYPIIANGVQGTVTDTVFTPVAVAVAPFAPPTASAIAALMWVASPPSPGDQGLAPNANFGGVAPSAPAAGIPPPPPLAIRGNLYGLPVTWLTLEGTSVYYAGSAASGVVSCMGWEDNL